MWDRWPPKGTLSVVYIPKLGLTSEMFIVLSDLFLFFIKYGFLRERERILWLPLKHLLWFTFPKETHHVLKWH